MRSALATAVLLALAVTGASAQPLSPRNANYTIAARLDPATRTITGSETIIWRNITEQAGRGSAVSPLLERLEEHALDIHARARARRRRRSRPRVRTNGRAST